VAYRKYDVNVTVIIHHKGGYWNYAMKDYQVYGKFNSLRNTLTNIRSNMSFS